MRSIKHEYIIELLEVYETSKHIKLIFENMKGGDLQKYIRKYGPLSEAIAIANMKKILLALLHIQTKGIVHRDLKPENIFLEYS